MQKRIPNHHHQRSAVADMISPDNGYRGYLERKGIKPTNYISKNTKDIRQLESKVREDKEIALQPKKELYKLSQFKDVPSKVYSTSNDENSEGRRNSTEEYLPKGLSELRREHIATKRRQERFELEDRLEQERLMNDKPPVSPRKNSVPRHTEVIKLAPRSNMDFIRMNRVEATSSVPTTTVSRTSDSEKSETKHSSFGRVPKYLEDRKAMWEQEKEETRRQQGDSDCPPGLKLMPEAERLGTLQVLSQNKQTLLQQLGNLPFVIETPSMIRRKNELEAKLKEIDNAISLFDRPKVYIKP